MTVEDKDLIPVVDEMRAIIERRGWGKDYHVDYNGRVCLEGALLLATGAQMTIDRPALLDGCMDDDDGVGQHNRHVRREIVFRLQDLTGASIDGYNDYYAEDVSDIYQTLDDLRDSLVGTP